MRVHAHRCVCLLFPSPPSPALPAAAATSSCSYLPPPRADTICRLPACILAATVLVHHLLCLSARPTIRPPDRPRAVPPNSSFHLLVRRVYTIMVRSSSSGNRTDGIATTIIRPYDLQRWRKRRQLGALSMRRRQLKVGRVLVRGGRGDTLMSRAVGIPSQSNDASRLLDLEQLDFAKQLATRAGLFAHNAKRKTIMAKDMRDALQLMGVAHFQLTQQRSRQRRRGPRAGNKKGADGSENAD